MPRNHCGYCLSSAAIVPLQLSQLLEQHLQLLPFQMLDAGSLSQSSCMSVESDILCSSAGSRGIPKNGFFFATIFQVFATVFEVFAPSPLLYFRHSILFIQVLESAVGSAIAGTLYNIKKSGVSLGQTLVPHRGTYNRWQTVSV
jgi:hypothetical protein